MKIYKSKGGYYYKEYKNGKKKRISNQEYNKNINKVNKLKGGGSNSNNNNNNINSNELIKPLVALKKIINKINERLKKSLNTVDRALGRLHTAKLGNNKYRTSQTPQVNNMNTLGMLGSLLNPQVMELNRLFSSAVQSIYKINKILQKRKKFRFNSRNNATNLEKIQKFYNSIIGNYFRQIQENKRNNDNILDAIYDYFDDETETIEQCGPIELWDVRDITDMSNIFEDITENREKVKKLNVDIGGWDVSNVTNMTCMFEDATSFNADISHWDVSNVTNMTSMFRNATSFNQDIGGWDVSNVTNMNGMFNDATSFNAYIGGWDVSKVTNMGYMFSYASSFNQDINTKFNKDGHPIAWDVSKVTNMLSMFQNATSFNTDISQWDISKISQHNRYSMFTRCPIKEEFKCKPN